MDQLRVLLVTFLLGAIGVAAMPATQFRSSGGILDTHIRITNGLGPDVDLSIHCKSADDDLGEHLIHYETVYGFDFRIKIFGGIRGGFGRHSLYGNRNGDSLKVLTGDRGGDG
ncbi:hypothetical protein GBA52_005090 [Prunus armeniaca]|nr:hypothetical protein GBA52_005090 [Prunus armeniaca]